MPRKPKKHNGARTEEGRKKQSEGMKKWIAEHPEKFKAIQKAGHEAGYKKGLAEIKQRKRERLIERMNYYSQLHKEQAIENRLKERDYVEEFFKDF